MIQSPETGTTSWDASLPHAIIEGKTVTFRSVAQKFDALVAEWQRIRGSGSSTASLVNDAYGQIVAMGEEVVPMLLREVKNDNGHWFSALRWITGISPVSAELHGDHRAMRQAWIRWGIEHGHIQADSTR